MKHKFKVGDKVRIKTICNAISYQAKNHPGKMFTVKTCYDFTHKYDAKNWGYALMPHLDNSCEGTWESEMEAAIETFEF